MVEFTSERIALGGLATAAILAGAACLFAMFRRHPTLVLPVQRFRAVPWAAGLCLWCFMLFWLPQQLVAESLKSAKSDRTDHAIEMLLASLICFPFQIALCKAMMRELTGTTLPLGVNSWRAVWRDLRIGCATWLVATTFVMAIQASVRFIAQQLIDTPLTEHTLIDLLRGQPVNSELWALVTLEAVLMAPAREELFFRGCLQPWLTRRPWGGDLAAALALIAPAALFANMGIPKIIACTSFVALSIALFWLLESRLRNWSGRWPWLFPPMARNAMPAQASYRGVVGTSLLFAAFHSSSWPDPVPLFAFGLVLGWLGWRTQGVVAPMVCHALFNATSLVILRLSAT